MVDSNDYNKWVQRAKQDIRTIENNLKDDPGIFGAGNLLFGIST